MPPDLSRNVKRGLWYWHVLKWSWLHGMLVSQGSRNLVLLFKPPNRESRRSPFWNQLKKPCLYVMRTLTAILFLAFFKTVPEKQVQKMSSEGKAFNRLIVRIKSSILFAKKHKCWRKNPSVKVELQENLACLSSPMSGNFVFIQQSNGGALQIEDLDVVKRNYMPSTRQSGENML